MIKLNNESDLESFWKRFGSIGWFWDQEKGFTKFISERISTKDLFIDFGCGDGRLIRELLKINKSINAIGFDLQIEEARSRFGEEYEKMPSNVSLKVADLAKFSQTNIANFGITSFVLEYAGPKAAKNVANAIKEGGELFWIFHPPKIIEQLISSIMEDENLKKHENIKGVISALSEWSNKNVERTYLTLKKHGLNPLIQGYYIDSNGSNTADFMILKKKNVDAPRWNLILTQEGKLINNSPVI